MEDPPSGGFAEPSAGRDEPAGVNISPSDGSDAPVAGVTESSGVQGDAGGGDSCVSWMSKSSGDSLREEVKSFS